MAISYNTGTTSTVTNSGTAGGHTFTIPAGVLSGDVILVCVWCFTTATGTITPTLTSSATTPTAIPSSPQATGTNAGINVVSSVFDIVATGSDPSATLTYGATGGSGGSYWYDVALVSYTGASGTGVPDCNNGNEAFSATFNCAGGTISTASSTTNTAGDWQVQFIGVAPSGSNADTTTPGSLTGRQSIGHTVNAGLLLYVADSNASVGGSGTSIGNTAWTISSGNASGNTWYTTFTVGLAPPSGAAVPGSVQPRATVPVPRRRPSRVVWAGSRPFLGFVAVPAPRQQPPVPRRKPARAYVRGSAPFLGFVAVPAPRQGPYRPPRRVPARAYVRGSAPFLGFVAVPAPRQQPGPAPRRKPARAYVQFTPVATVNAVIVTRVPGTIPVLQAAPASTIVRRTSMVVRH